MTDSATPHRPAHGSPERLDPSDVVYDRMVRAQHFAQEQWKPLAAGAAAIVLVACIGIGVRQHRNTTAIAAASAYFDAAQIEADSERLEALVAVADEHAATGSGLQAAFEAAQLAFQAEDYEQAQTLFTQILDTHPDSPLASAALLGNGAAFEAQGEAAQADAAYRRALAEYPEAYTRAQARWAVGRLAEARGDTDAAIEQYRRLVSDHANTAWSQRAEERLAELAPEPFVVPAEATLPVVPGS